jgi:hypothetical protein
VKCVDVFGGVAYFFLSVKAIKLLSLSIVLKTSTKQKFFFSLLLLSDTHDERDVWNIINEKYPMKTRRRKKVRQISGTSH